jgi:non-ribosomal peptide synthetase component F
MDRGQLAIPADLAGAIRELAGEAGAETSTVLLAAFAALVSRYTGETSLVVGLAGGADANVLAVPCDLSGRPTVSQALTRLREAVTEARARRAARPPEAAAAPSRCCVCVPHRTA